MGYRSRMLMVLVTILISLSYSLVNLAILITYQIRSPSYWSFWIFNTSTFIFGFCSVILIKAVPAMRTWIVDSPRILYESHHVLYLLSQHLLLSPELHPLHLQLCWIWLLDSRWTIWWN